MRSDGEGAAVPDLLLLSCEHGGNEVPADFAALFCDARQALDSHRGYDIGALGVALRLTSQHAAPIFFSTTTRLLIDLNRSLDSPTVFSECMGDATDEERRTVISRYYEPYRQRLTQLVASSIDAGHRVIHVGIHSFTDVLDENERAFDLALLFDEARPDEAAFCERWQQAMASRSSELRYRFNEPYRGSDDGLTTKLRQQFPADRYLGLEVEVRQGMLSSLTAQHQIGDLLAAGLHDVLAL